MVSIRESFDSILVRLKGMAKSLRVSLLRSFDSILVRLKVPGQCFQEVRKWFRFHTGSIKSQTHQESNTPEKFRFHTGSIKSETAPLQKGIQNGRKFRFHTGSIKSFFHSTTAFSRSSVSIPYWFD